MDAHSFAHHQPLYYDQAFAASSSSHSQQQQQQQHQLHLNYNAHLNPSSSSSSSSLHSSPASLPAPFQHHDDDAFHHHPGSPDNGAQDPSMTTLQAFTQDNGLAAGLSRPLTHQEHDRLANLERLKLFLATAPSAWSNTSAASPPTLSHPALNRFLLPNQEYVTCVVWGGLYHITGTDIVRALVFRFEAFGRPVRNMKKFEEGIFSDLRNLKPGVDACLEEPKSPFLDLLFKYQCIRTQKKQKVFYWFSVPHDRLFLDALERDLKREKMGLEPTTVVAGEPAQSFTYDPKRTLFEQFSKPGSSPSGSAGESDDAGGSSDVEALPKSGDDASAVASTSDAKPAPGPNPAFFSMFSLFEGSPSYKTRRRRQPKTRRSSPEYGSPYGHPAYRPVDEHQIRPSVSHELGLGLSAGDVFLAQANATPRYLPALDGAPDLNRAPLAFRTEPIRHHTYPLYAPMSASAASTSFAEAQQLQQQQQAPTRTVKAYTCPLFSCGRLFKRMEHLKRHVRTHTLERPFPCGRCTKRFARADNLQQHLRIHARADSLGVSPTEPTEDDDAELVDLGGGAPPVEVEVQVRGDLPDEGLTPPLPLAAQPADGSFFSYGAAQASNWQQQQQQQRTGGSPAFTHLSAPSPAPYSAPSQQASFDHSALFPPAVAALDLNAGPGPIRRHRSATPAEGHGIRRPATAFHPYAHASHGSMGSSHGGMSSTRSSPAGYTVALDFGGSEGVFEQQHHHHQQAVAAFPQYATHAHAYGEHVPAPAFAYAAEAPIVM